MTARFISTTFLCAAVLGLCGSIAYALTSLGSPALPNNAEPESFAKAPDVDARIETSESFAFNIGGEAHLVPTAGSIVINGKCYRASNYRTHQSWECSD